MCCWITFHGFIRTNELLADQTMKCLDQLGYCSALRKGGTMGEQVRHYAPEQPDNVGANPHSPAQIAVHFLFNLQCRSTRLFQSTPLFDSMRNMQGRSDELPQVRPELFGGAMTQHAPVERRGYHVKNSRQIEVVKRKGGQLKKHFTDGFMDQRVTCCRCEGNPMSIEDRFQLRTIGAQRAGDDTDVFKLIPVRLDEIEDCATGHCQFFFNPDDTSHEACKRLRVSNGVSRRSMRQTNNLLCLTHKRPNVAIEEALGKLEREVGVRGEKERGGNRPAYRLEERQLHLSQVVKPVVTGMLERGEKWRGRHN